MMKRYIVFRQSDGEIIKHGICAPGDFDLQAADGETAIEGEITNETHIIDGEPVRIEPPSPDPSVVAEMEFVNSVTIAKAKIALDHENRLRVLEGKPAIDRQAFIQYLKGLA
jgi:hypothetical protein